MLTLEIHEIQRRHVPARVAKPVLLICLAQSHAYHLGRLMGYDNSVVENDDKRSAAVDECRAALAGFSGRQALGENMKGTLGSAEEKRHHFDK